MRALNIKQFTRIFVGEGSHAYKLLWTPPSFLRLDLADCKDILSDCICFIWIPRWL